ncbi:MAG: GGDEF domain-containing protein [Burkholderiaceae bacterium]|nr:GGDEF domain-containing protein [Burkholderiaceae bacterium]
MQSFMDVLDRPTLSIFASIMWSLGLLVMFSIWRINRQLPGTKWWLMSFGLFVVGFLVSGPIFRALGWSGGYATAINNTAVVSAMLCLLAGSLQFRGMKALPRWCAVLPLVFFVFAFWWRDQPTWRYFVLYPTLIILLCAVAWVMLWRIEPHERLVHGMAAGFMLMMVPIFLGRLWQTLHLRDDALLMAHDYQKLVFLSVSVFAVGTSYSISLACYLRTHHGLLSLARQDVLTGLPNRRHFEDTLSQELARSQRTGTPFALCMIDLNRFKEVNDRYGHGVGDTLLIEVAQRLRQGIRQSDFAARLGGDEFVVLAHSISANDPSGAVLQRLREAVDGVLALAQCTLPVSISVGIAMWPTDGTDAEQLLHVADEQMYLDKQARRGACA